MNCSEGQLRFVIRKNFTPQTAGPKPLNHHGFLSVEHISKTFPGVRALDDVSVEFEKASVHAVMGENGAAKVRSVKLSPASTRPTKE